MTGVWALCVRLNTLVGALVCVLVVFAVLLVTCCGLDLDGLMYYTFCLRFCAACLSFAIVMTGTSCCF